MVVSLAPVSDYFITGGAALVKVDFEKSIQSLGYHFVVLSIKHYGDCHHTYHEERSQQACVKFFHFFLGVRFEAGLSTVVILQAR